ncbi:MAG TPA: glycoside hydrolase family 2 TIM barrel-domain containing protein [Ignavibacteriaceae bacterium]|nr:glycoside hydrolase family 2 TIM barrel-domain containing protein [Ignavibacteriaceae bacterium]
MLKKKELNENWNFSLADSSNVSIPNSKIKIGKWFPATVPGTIHTDLLNNNLIDDPFYSDIELKLFWITGCDWVYQTEFDFNGGSGNNINLVFEGLDTVSEIYLNDVKVGETNNMFLSYRYDIKNILKPTRNLLKIIFLSPIKYSNNQENTYGKLPVALNSSRVYIRKAQYSFGWDWGPSFPTSGIWRKVYIEEYNDVRIENVTFQTTTLKNNSALGEVAVEVKDNKSNNISLYISLFNEQNIYEKIIALGNAVKYKSTFEIENPKLWWPNGEGEQNLYSLNIKLIDKNENVLDEINKNVGIRKLELILNEEEESSFKFRINNKDIYCQGVNWIPADSFLPRIHKEKYFELLSFAKEANMNMVRVWGGGIYEDDEFYSLCDQFGLLVWQDFMFACGSYPEHESFIKNIKKEITENVLNLQHHPSIAIWCGNNENEWIWYQEQKTIYKKMPGYKIYHDIIPEILNELDPSRPYWQSSPFGNDEDPNSFGSGNNHQWDLWSRWIDYNNVVNDKSLFVTEFGFQGPANKSTFEKYLPKENRKIQDKIFEFHNKQVEGPERLIKFLTAHLPLNTGWNDFIYLAQLSQALALKTCLEYWKFLSEKTMGSIIWQLNDCWPVTSWALIDCELRPKFSYHFVKNVFAQNSLCFIKKENDLQLIIQNNKNEHTENNIKLSLFDISTGNIIYEEIINIKNERPHFNSLEIFSKSG